MSISNQIQRIQIAKNQLKISLENKGTIISQNIKFDRYYKYMKCIYGGRYIEPLHFKVLDNGTIYWKTNNASWTKTIEYSKDGGETWTSITSTTEGTEISVNNGDIVYIRGNNTTYGSSSYYCYFAVSSGLTFEAHGNIMNLLSDGENMGYYCFRRLFYNCIGLITMPELPATTLVEKCYNGMFQNCTSLITVPLTLLPATSLSSCCYQNMFRGCTGLTSTPALPATTLSDNCYSYMFYGCTSLTTTPVLPATTLSDNCYSYMFQSCTCLTTAPELPATTLADYCYSYMFYGCTSLITVPCTLPATTLSDNCYSYMFYGCTSLTTAPSLPATTLAQYCYSNMFRGCRSLTNIPSILPVTTLVQGCYQYMFYGCTSLTTAPVLPATTLVQYCYQYMFYGCTNLNYIMAMFTTTPSSTYTNSWVSSVASTGTFVKNSTATWTTTGNNGVPTGWTVQTEIDYRNKYFTIEPLENGTIKFSTNALSYSTDDGTTWTDLPANTNINVTTGNNILFRKNDNELSIITGLGTFTSSNNFNVSGNIMSLLFGSLYKSINYIFDYSFYQLFYYCTHLISAQNLILPVTTLGDYCYSQMFYNCTSLTNAPHILSATILKPYCYQSMFSNCTSLTTTPSLPATTLADYCYQYMFSGCTSLINVPSTLPATTLRNFCYAQMFSNCTSLITAPVLPATTLVQNCYSGMFSGCSHLNYIICYATNPNKSYMENWVYGVASTGTFVGDSQSDWNRGKNGVPKNWNTNVNINPLPESNGTLGMWIDDFLVIDNSFDDWIDDPESYGTNEYVYTNNTMNYNGTTYYVWERTDGDNETYYALTTTVNYNTLYNQSIEHDVSNVFNHPVSYFFNDNMQFYSTCDDQNILKVEQRNNQLYMWVDDFIRYDGDIQDFIDDPESMQSNYYEYCEPFEYDGDTYYIWEMIEYSSYSSNIKYILTDTINLQTLQSYSLESSLNNITTFPIVAYLDEDLQETYWGEDRKDNIISVFEL